MDDKTDISSGELLNFLKQFQTNMETKLEANKESLERKLDDRLNQVDLEVKKVCDKIDENEDKHKNVNDRMERRLDALEQEMEKMCYNKKRNKDLKTSLREKDYSEQTGRTKMINKNIVTKEISDKVIKTTEDIRAQPAGTFRSSWAKGIELELRKAAEQAGTKDNSETERVDSTRDMIEKINARNDNVRDDRDDERTVPDRWDDDEEKNDHDHDRDPKPLDWNLRMKRNDRMKIQPGGLKVRKPPTVTKWFGIDSNSDDTEEDDKAEWTDVDRKNKSEEIKKRKIKRKWK